MTVVAEKTMVRAEALARRSTIPAAVGKAFARRLAKAGPAFIGQRAAPPGIVVSVYHPIRGEADTMPLLEALARAGFVTALPKTLGRGKPLQFRRWRWGDAVAPGQWGIAEPLPDAPPVDPDVLFLPLAAFDRQGFRLGYGAGFYDNALTRLRRQKAVMAIGVAFGVQEVDRVPREPHDQRLDALMTEDETHVFGSE